MPQPSFQSVHVNRPLTNISVMFLQRAENFAANSIFPRVPVQKASDLYFTYPKSYFLRNQTRKRDAGAQAPISGYTVSTTPYTTLRDAVAKQIPDPIRENADAPLDLDREATLWVAQQLLIAQEVDFASSFFSTGIWTGSSTGSDITPTTTWDDVTSTPVEDIRTQNRALLQNTGYEGNCLLLGKTTFDRLIDHPDILDRIKHAAQTNGNPAVANEQTLAAILGLERVLVARAVKETEQEGQAATSGFILNDKAALLAYAAPSAGIFQPSAGYKFVWGGAGNALGVQIKRYRREDLESDIIEGGIWYDHAVISAALGVFFTAAVA